MSDDPLSHLAGSTLLLVDDDELLRERMSRALRDRGLMVRTAGGGAEALEIVSDWEPELAVVDLKMPGMNGHELLAELKETCPGARVVMLTGYGSIASAVEAMHAGAENYVTKPADADQVLEAFHRSGVIADEQAPPVEETAAHTPTLADAEWNHIQQVMADCGGNITKAADRLGIPRRSLQRKLKKLP
ncbi:MAG: response regulator [Planctomycetota bacterium]